MGQTSPEGSGIYHIPPSVLRRSDPNTLFYAGALAVVPAEIETIPLSPDYWARAEAAGTPHLEVPLAVGPSGLHPDEALRIAPLGSRKALRGTNDGV